MEIYDLISETFGINLDQVLLRGSIATLLIIAGIFLGSIISIGLKKLSQKLDLSKYIRGSFIDLSIGVIRWSVYIIFLTFGLNQLQIPTLTNFFTSILITIPAFAGALILLVLGFALAYYLRGVIKNSEVKGCETLSQIIFYFVLYIFGVYALKTALISFSESTTNFLIITLTATISLGIVYLIVKKTYA